MENTATTAETPVQVGIRYGLLFGIIGIIVDFGLKVTELAFKFSVAMPMSILVWVVGIVLAHRYFKSQNGGLMTFGQGVIISIVLGTISAILTGAFNYVYINFIDPDYVTAMRADMEAWMMGMNVPEDQLDKALADISQEKMGSVLSIGKVTLGGSIGGAVLGLIISAFTKHKLPEFE
ncbi:DUF4199 domain-containing protein [Hymenobacter canadensis]|uniref:DUF4199 domain-containing protein n=1 Tax=Hymenobacter canadensis TaxID=2999067 RepID=A0ABY7LUQ4_9BACT|nr:DUF4199 domain-containing protein [Hymenobacter canadensis]WBA43751.1 DUF4199 domain-containing protein [Hymenobacter canadensis]